MDRKHRKLAALNKETHALNEERKRINIHPRGEAKQKLKCCNDKEARDECSRMAEKRKRKHSRDMEKQKRFGKTDFIFDEVQEKKKTSECHSFVAEVSKKHFAKKFEEDSETKKEKKIRKTRKAGEMNTISVDNETKESLIMSQLLDEVIEENSKHVYAKEGKKRKNKKEINENSIITKNENTDKSFSVLANEGEQNLRQDEKKKKKVKKRRQKEDKIADKDSKSTEEGNGNCPHPALQYLHQWKKNRDCWRFQKVRQTWLLQNMYNRTKVPDEDFKVLIKYLQGLRGAARLKTITDAEKLIENEETTNGDAGICVDRVKQVVQEITEE